MTTKRLDTGDRIVDFLQEIKDISPKLLKGRWGLEEPLRNPLDSAELEGLREKVGVPFIWRSHGGKIEGSIWSGARADRHTMVSLRVRDPIEVQEFGEIVVELAVKISADFAYLHPITAAEREDKKMSRLWGPLHQGVTTHELRDGMPGPGWLTVLGPPYVDLFGLDKLLSAPVGEVRQVLPSLVVLKLLRLGPSSSFDYQELAAKRLKLIEHLGPEFFSLGGRVSSEYVPSFRLIENPKVAANRAFWDALLEKKPE